MSRAAAIGDGRLVAGYALAGVEVLAGDPLAAWESLPEDVGLVLLTPAAADAIGHELELHPDVLTAVLPP